MVTVSTEPSLVLAPRARSLRANMSWTFMAYAVYGAGQWTLLIFIAKLGSAEMLGIYSLGVAIATPVLMLSSLNLRSVLVTDLRNQHSFYDYLGVRATTTLIAIMVIGGILVFSHTGWIAAATTLIVAIGLAAEAMSDICYGPLQRDEQMDIIATSICYRSLVSVIALGICLWFIKSIVFAVIGLSVARLFVMATFDLPRHLKKTSKSAPRWRMATHSPDSPYVRIIWTALPLGIVLMLNSLNTNIPRYVINAHGGARDLGIFAAIASAVTIGGTVVNSLGQAAMPQLAKKFSAGELRDFTHLLLKLLGTIALLGLSGVAFSSLLGRDFLKYAFRPEYAQHSHLLILIMWAGAISYMTMILGYCQTAAQYFRPQVPLLLAGTVSAVIASHYLIPSHGLLGAVYSIGISWTVVLIGELIILVAIFRDLRGRSTVLAPAVCGQ